jgi:protein phosphatase
VYARIWEKNEESPAGLKALLAVADGMGGHERGEWASGTAIQVLGERIEPGVAESSIVDFLTGLVQEAHLRIQAGGGDGENPPGTTFSIAAVQKNRCTIAHVGDSRIYLFRNGRIRQITRDDTLVDMLKRRDEAPDDKEALANISHVLIKAVGRSDDISPSIHVLNLKRGDKLLLCSDGLTDMLPDSEIAEILLKSRSAAHAGEMLCADADNAGGLDNISVVLYSHGDWDTSAFSARRGVLFWAIFLLMIAGTLFVLIWSEAKGFKFALLRQHTSANQREERDISSYPDMATGRITGPDRIRVGASAGYTLDLVEEQNATFQWMCDPPDAGSFDDPKASATVFTPTGSASNKTITIFVRISQGERLLEVASREIRILPPVVSEPITDDKEKGSADEGSGGVEDGSGDNGDSEFQWWL